MDKQQALLRAVHTALAMNLEDTLNAEQVNGLAGTLGFTSDEMATLAELWKREGLIELHWGPKLSLTQAGRDKAAGTSAQSPIQIYGGNFFQTQIGTSGSTLNAYIEALQLDSYSSEDERELKQALAALRRGIESAPVLTPAQRLAASADLASFTEEIKKPPNEQNLDTKKLFWGRLTEVLKFSAALVTLAAAVAKLTGLA